MNKYIKGREGEESTNKTVLMAFVSFLLFSVTLTHSARCQSPPPTDPYVYVLVWRYYDPNDPLSSAISTYKQDLENAGFSAEIKFRPDLGNTPEGIRELLQNEALTHEIAGVLLVGDVPYASYEMEVEGWNYTFPCDLYYMDLDGNWTDSDDNGVYDGHGGGDGDLEPEIWVGRLWASTITGDEEELLINYFDKNHRFRTRELTLPKRALAYIDDHAVYWADEVNSSLNVIYENAITLVIDPKTTNATDYKNRLNYTSGYEWIHLESHGNFMVHAFRIAEEPVPASWTYVYSSEIRSIDPHAFFYNIMACDSADFTCRNLTTDYIGGSYIFADTYGLLVVGCAKPGQMLNYSDFYGPMGEGKCIGQAFKEWFEKNGELSRTFYYGLTILGDPALRTTPVHDIAITAMTFSKNPKAGEKMNIFVAIQNQGDFCETFTVSVYYTRILDPLIGTKNVVNLANGTETTLNFEWTPPGDAGYNMRAEASVVRGETDIDGNTFRTYLCVGGHHCGENPNSINWIIFTLVFIVFIIFLPNGKGSKFFKCLL